MGNTNCGTCGCSPEEDLNQLTNLTPGERKKKLNLEVNELLTKHIKEVLFIQRKIKQFLLKKQEEKDPHKFHKHHPSMTKKPNLNDISTSNDSLLNKEILFVENLRINDAIYTGEIKDGKRNGKGTQIWDNGAKYEGEWLNDQVHGYEIGRAHV